MTFIVTINDKVVAQDVASLGKAMDEADSHVRTRFSQLIDWDFHKKEAVEMKLTDNSGEFMTDEGNLIEVSVINDSN